MDRLHNLLCSTSQNLVFLIETKIHGDRAKNIGRLMGYQNHMVVDSIGCSGRLILF